EVGALQDLLQSRGGGVDVPRRLRLQRRGHVRLVDPRLYHSVVYPVTRHVDAARLLDTQGIERGVVQQPVAAPLSYECGENARPPLAVHRPATPVVADLDEPHPVLHRVQTGGLGVQAERVDRPALAQPALEREHVIQRRDERQLDVVQSTHASLLVGSYSWASVMTRRITPASAN